MKFNKSSQLVLISAASLAAATLVSACSQLTQTLTVDFVYVASSKAAGPDNYGEIDVYEVDSESGRMRPIPSSPFPSGGRNPVAEATSADNNDLFVANQDDNSIVQFVIGTDGKLYPFNTVNTPGIYPRAIAANASNLFVVDTYQPLPICSTADPCSGSIGVFPLTAATKTVPVKINPPATNTAVSGNYWPLSLSGSTDIIAPTGVNVLASGSYVYVTAYDSTATPHVGYVFAFWVVPTPSSTSMTTAAGVPIPAGVTCPAPAVTPTSPPSAGNTADAPGTLCPLNSSPFAAGVQPSAVASASDASGAYLYVTDFGNADVLAYNISSSNGALSAMSGSPFAAGNQPSAIVANQHYPYVYVTNSVDATITAYSTSNGALTRVDSYATGLDPVAIGIDPSTDRFLYTANFLGNSVTGYELSTTAGTLVSSQFSPFAANDQPTAVAAIPHNGTGGGVQP